MKEQPKKTEMKEEKPKIQEKKVEKPLQSSTAEIKAEERFIPKKMEKVMETKPTQPMQQSISVPQKKIDEPQHESRQNIVGDAKIATDALKTNLQNLSTQLNSTVNKMKSNMDKSAVYKTDVFDQMKLTSQGKDIASTFRTNQDPNFGRSNTEDLSAVEKENFQEGGIVDNSKEKSTERVITPHDDRVITTEGDKVTAAYPLTKELKKGQQVVETKLNEKTDVNTLKGQDAPKEKGRMQVKQKEEKKVM